MLAAIRTSLGLTDAEISALLILNVALTIPARIVVGMLVDRFGPRLVYSALLMLSGLRRPNAEYLNVRKRPLLERNPTAVWHGIAIALFVLNLLLLCRVSR